MADLPINDLEFPDPGVSIEIKEDEETTLDHLGEEEASIKSEKKKSSDTALIPYQAKARECLGEEKRFSF